MTVPKPIGDPAKLGPALGAPRLQRTGVAKPGQGTSGIVTWGIVASGIMGPPVLHLMWQLGHFLPVFNPPVRPPIITAVWHPDVWMCQNRPGPRGHGVDPVLWATYNRGTGRGLV